MDSKWIWATLAAVMMAVLGCITVEVLPGEETPLGAVVPFPSPTWTPVRSGMATPIQMPSPTSVGPTDPSVSRVFFASEVSRGTDPANVATEFPGGTTRVYAFATYEGMPDGSRCESVWYVDGQEVARTSFDWALSQSGETWVDLMQEDGGLAPGRYNWELLVEGELMGGGAFVVGAPTTGTPGPEVTSTAARVQGPRIVFVSLRDRNNELYIVNPDGTGVVRLTNNSDVDYDPACSPDGGRIAFMSARDGNTEIYVMNTDGRGATRLTNNPDVDISPTWSPDGSRIAFVSYTGTNGEIYVMNSDGSGVVRVTNNPADDWDPTWCAR